MGSLVPFLAPSRVPLGKRGLVREEALAHGVIGEAVLVGRTTGRLRGGLTSHDLVCIPPLDVVPRVAA